MKTRKPDAAERIAAKYEAWSPEGLLSNNFPKSLTRDIRRALNAAKRPVWRPMSEPPEPDTPVLLCYGNGEVMDQTAWISASGHWFTRNSQIHYVADGHWTELPPPPKARKGASQ